MLSTAREALRRLWRLSALRQALLLTAAFSLVIAAAAVFAVFEVRDAMDRQLDDRLEARFNALREEVALAQRASVLETVIFLPSSAPGARGYGRTGIFFDRDLIPPQARGHGEPWMFFGGAVPGGWLIVGQDVGEMEVFDEVLADVFIGIGWGTVLVALSLGLFLGWRTQKRLSVVTSVLDRAAQGDLTARVAPQRNRDDLDQLGLQVDDSIARIGAALEQARGFSANIAHDLKTPLTRLRIRLETALLAEGDREDEIGAALEQADKAIAIFDAFLRLSKLESGALEQRFETVDLCALTRDVADTYAAVIEDSGRSLHCDLAPVHLRGDAVLLNQFLSNLIQNALRHTPQGTRLTLVARPGVLGLMDDGPGIPEAERAHVTRPLYRLDRSRSTDGAGLGLALVKSIAARHGAALELGDPPQGGTGLFARMVWGRTRKSET